MDTTIEARGLTKRYGGTVAVDDLSFTVAPDRVTGFVGPNGAGKSTTMRLILGLDAPDAGGALVSGERYARLRNPLREVGAVLDATAVHPGRRARDHLLWLAQAGGLPRGRVTEVLELVGLAPVSGRRAGGFSLGMRQRLGIAAALLGDPPVLLLDEPVNGLDPEGIRWFREFAKGLAAEGRAVFVSSHLMTELEDTADHLVIIGRGRVLVRTPQPAEVMTVLAGAGATVVATGQDALTVSGLPTGRIAEETAGRGLRLYELAPYRASLEEAYLELTRNAVEYRTTAPRATRRR